MIWLITAPEFSGPGSFSSPDMRTSESTDSRIQEAYPEPNGQFEAGDAHRLSGKSELLLPKARSSAERESFASEQQIIFTAFEAGLQTLLLRKPGWTEAAYSRWLEQLPIEHRGKVIISTYPALAVAFGLKGVHLSEEARAKTAPDQLEKLRQAGKSVSTSVHDESADTSGFDSVLLGPVFDSISKPGYPAKMFRTIPPNAIAVGGIHIGNVRQAREKGFSGAAVLGAVWNEPARTGATIAALLKEWPPESPAGQQSLSFLHPFNPKQL